MRKIISTLMLAFFVLAVSGCEKDTLSHDANATEIEVGNSTIEETVTPQDEVNNSHSESNNTEDVNTQNISEKNTWKNNTIDLQEGKVKATFSAKPMQNKLDTVIGFSNGEANSYTDLGIIVRFAPSGYIDVRNGGKYEALQKVAYSANVTYFFTVEINFDLQQYTVYVKTPENDNIELAKGFKFRSEQSNMSEINNMGYYTKDNDTVVSSVSFEEENGSMPVITLQGDETVTINTSEVYIEQGASVMDVEDGNITDLLVIDNTSVNEGIAGTYTVRYNATDSDENKAGEVLRTVIIKEVVGQATNDKHVDILTIGDSFTDGADYLTPLVNKLKSSDHQNIAFVGTKKDQEISHEGREGWDASGYMNLNPKWYPDSPFLNNNTIDFPNYFQNKLKVQPDIVIIQLGLNDVIAATKGVIKGYNKRETIIEKKIADITLLTDNIRKSLPQAKILMMMPTEQNENDQTNTNAEAIGITNKNLNKELMHEYQAEYLAKFDNREKEGIFILKTYEYLDVKKDFRDFVHPNTQGFKKIAEALHDRLLYLISSGENPEEAVSILGKKIFEIDFNKHPVGTYTKSMHRGDFYTYNGENLYYKNHDGTWMYGTSGPDDTLSIIEEGNEKVLRVLYKKNKFGLGNYPNRETYTGFASLSALPKNNRPKEDINNPQEVTLTYYVKFEKDFEWVIGGKLPGLAGGIAPGGSAIVGSERLNNGFTARFMWHMRVSDGKNISSLIGYIYHPGRAGNTGDKIYGAGSHMSTINPTTSFTDRPKTSLFEFKTDNWYKIKQTIKANRPYKSDGTMKVWINDQLATSYGDMKYIADGKHGEYGVDRLLFATFYGGGTQEYAPSRDTYTRFKDIQVHVK